jgi:hypothetical protein
MCSLPGGSASLRHGLRLRLQISDRRALHQEGKAYANAALRDLFMGIYFLIRTIASLIAL